MRYSLRRRQDGYILVTVTITIFVLALLGLGLLELCRMESLLVTKDIQQLKAFHLAEAGIDRALWTLTTDPTWTAGWDDQLLSSGSYSVAVDAGSKPNWYYITSAGTTGNVSSTVVVSVTVRRWPAAFDYAIFRANPSSSPTALQLDNMILVDGSVFSYGDLGINQDSGVSNGSVYSTGDVTGTGEYTVGEVSGDLPERVPLDTSSYDDAISQAAGADAGDWSLDGGNYSLDGQTLHVNGNVILGNASILNGPGRIVATGNIEVGNSTVISGGVDLISGASLLIDNSTSYQGDGNILFARDEIELQNAVSAGDNLTILTPGTLSLSNAASVRGIVWAGNVDLQNGCSVVGTIYAEQFEADVLLNNVTIQYDDSVLGSTPPAGIAECPPRIVLGSWEEI